MHLLVQSRAANPHLPCALLTHLQLGTDLDFTTVVSTALFGGHGVMMVQGVVDAIANNNAAFMAAVGAVHT